MGSSYNAEQLLATLGTECHIKQYETKLVTGFVQQDN